jgi:ATP phosphoribosyltransferase regulatory subunit
MSSAWLLPEHIADVLPSQARRIEALRGSWLERARRCGFELVMPPLLEHLESLLSGTGRELDLQTFKLVDQLSGRTMGLRADTTPQVARIDAHLLNREGVARLCYCGPVLRTRADGPNATREPLQFGAEIYGHAGLEAELEAIELALDGLRDAGIERPVLDLGDARIVRGVLAGVAADAHRLADVVAALAAKDAAALDALAQGFGAQTRSSLRALLTLYGDDEVLDSARAQLPARALVTTALDDLGTLARHVRRTHAHARVGFDLADMRGYAYYSGTRFAIYAAGASDALVRGGRYDEVGAVFGRNRPAVGFSLDLKALAAVVAAEPPRAAVRAPWSDDDESLRQAIRRLRDDGETVVCVLPGHEHESQEFDCDRELTQVDGRWLLRAL